MKRFVLMLCVVSALVILNGCNKDDDDEKEFASIVGVWNGKSVDYKFTPSGLIIGYDDTEEFDGTVEFKGDGTLEYSYNANESSGTYTVVGNKLTTDINFTEGFPFTAQTFKIVKLTNSQMQLYFEEEGNFEVPEIGSLEGTIEATIYFER